MEEAVGKESGGFMLLVMLHSNSACVSPQLWNHNITNGTTAQ
jgi:hypothetical protein